MNQTVVQGSTTQAVAPPTTSGQPINVDQKQSATVVNDGRAAPAALASPAPATLRAQATPGAAPPAIAATGGTAAVAQGLKADNAVTNDAAVVLNISGGNYAPITIVVETVTRIVNTGAAIAESGGGLIGGVLHAASGTPGGQRAQGALISNDVALGSDVTMRIAGDNHTPIRIVIEIAASLWNRGVAMLGGSPSDAPASARSAPGAGVGSTTGLIVRNRLNLWAHAYIDILGSNYAPIDVNVRIVSETVNIGLAATRTGGQAPIPENLERADAIRSGSASCLGSATMALVGNVQSATVITPKDASAKRASNSFDASVGGASQVGCASGPAAGHASNVTSGSVEALGSVSTVVVGSVQTADASANLKAPAPTDDVSVERERPQPPTNTSPSSNTSGTSGTSGRGSSAASGAVTPIVAPGALTVAPHTPAGPAGPVRAAAPVYFPTYQEYTADVSGDEMPLQTLSTWGVVPVAGAEGAPPTSPMRSDLLAALILLLVAIALFLLARLGLRRQVSRQPAAAAA
jgi:hypothetical protein